MPRSPFSTLTVWFQRAPILLPKLADRGSEWWWSQPARVRLALPGALLLVAALTALSVAAQDDHVDVFIATRDVPAGATLTATDVTRQSRPDRFVPPSALRTVEGVASQMIPRGSVLTAHHISDGGASAVLGPDEVAVAFARTALPPVSLGDRVTLVDITYDGQARTVATAALLFYQDSDVIWFAVPERDAVAVAAAAHHGRISTIVHPRDTSDPPAR